VEKTELEDKSLRLASMRGNPKGISATYFKISSNWV